LNWLKASILRNLKIGSVVYAWCDFCTPAKNKYLLVVAIEPSLLVLVINSVVNQFYIANGQEAFHVLVPQEEHPFLHHDSHACCVEAIDAFDISFMHSSILADYDGFHRGYLSTRCLKEVYEAVLAQKLIRRGYKMEILASLVARLSYSLSNDSIDY
jgi:hypothetical protein